MFTSRLNKFTSTVRETDTCRNLVQSDFDMEKNLVIRFEVMDLWVWIVVPVTKKDMQTARPPLRSGHLYIKDAECAESNEKIKFFWFIFFELLMIFVHSFHVSFWRLFWHLKRCAMFWIGILYSWVSFVRFLDFEIWSIGKILV